VDDQVVFGAVDHMLKFAVRRGNPRVQVPMIALPVQPIAEADVFKLKMPKYKNS
jgi:hypothetical protein